ncbi:MAG TPA: UvrD-helicase domain-containing protein [Gemmatales bacterium]|nr:UvrD-helicase domain-containing protein [Gemmatales bacterium]HMP59224.1 UvrD-helicase domain-containing protein [Gemmatales bacterium]
MMDLLHDLTPAQRAAVTHLEGPLLVIAGPGSGKTRVITRRVAHLLQQGIRPWNILAITFTNKAAAEMRRRVDAIVPKAKIRICTFHSLGAYLLRTHADQLGLDRNFTIYDQTDRLQVVRASLALAGIDDVRFTPDRIQGAISRAKNQLLTPAEFAATADDFFAQTVARVYPIYEQQLRAAAALDFDDLLYHVALMLRSRPELRAELDERFRFVLVDEYQDTNFAQYVIARHLSMDHPNLTVVGDPDQSIYRWRGSDLRNILDFERDYPGAKVVLLDENYRSTKNILAVAAGLIAHNGARKDKNLHTSNPEGGKVAVLEFASSHDEAAGLAQRIQAAVEAGGRRYRDIAIFLRMNALSRTLETAFIKHRVPYQIVRGVAFFERKENKDILAYLRLLLNPRDDLSFLRVVNEPARGIGKTSLEHLKDYCRPRDLALLEGAHQADKIPTLRGKAAVALQRFAHLMGELRSLAEAPPDVVIKEVIDKSGYRGMLTASKVEEDDQRLANIEELISAAQDFAAEAEDCSLEAFLEHVTLASDQDALDEKNDLVSIMTLHAAKGLEFPVVFMPALEQGILPHDRSSQDREELEEERRLAFVGITRAQEELTLSYAQMREFRGRTLYAIPSPFLEELPRDRLQRVHVAMDGHESGLAWEYPDDHAAEATSAWKASAHKREQARWPTEGRAPLPASTAPVAALGGRPDADRFVVSAYVRHRDYGQGQILEVNGYGAQCKVRIRFGTVGEKTFILAKAPLELLVKK